MSVERLQRAINLIHANDQAGAEEVRALAFTGDPQALFVLAHLHWSETLVDQDPVRARALFEAAAARGHVQANLVVTNLLASGVAGRRDWAAAIGRLRVEAGKIPARTASLQLLQAMKLDSSGEPTQMPASRNVADRPDARLFEKLLTPQECQYLVAAAGQFEPSMVYDAVGQLVQDTIRTSDGASFSWDSEDPAIHALNRRVAAASGTRYDQGEALQVLRYSPGQEYRPHFDWVDGAPNQRIWTALIYLNDDYEGGATAFVRTGVEVRGRTGDVLLFSNVGADGNADQLAEHAGMPVTSGTKYLATRWIRERRWIP
ncbi:2OG-Fe(II) oxygenase [Sphingomonas flavescens]|uniref:prolyl hydroxylase family protein n=1 Tax=Sphingomonas flavescens TaxID=3132797 RepID=UPI0028051E00|nr:2OG-Fe(II) oxygenase [Sphingomonas limnosediminicola]